MESIRFALNHFGVSGNDLKRTLSAALEKGGDYADLFFEHTCSNSIGLQDGTVNRASSNIDFGMGVRVISGDQTGYAYVEDITPGNMLKAAQTAARIASGNSGSREPVSLTEVTPAHDFYTVHTAWDEVAVKDKMPWLQQLNDRIFATDPRVTKVIAGLGDTASHIFFCNSAGEMCYDYRPMAQLQAQCIMVEGNRLENNYAGRSFRMGAEFLTDELVNTLAAEVVDRVEPKYHQSQQRDEKAERHGGKHLPE
ncbi:MAG: hypothetical protein LBR86_07855, partial [Tannerella sp.]|nr:hypothetical protein [Tannerella sp.]